MEQKNLRVGKIDKITERAVLGFVNKKVLTKKA